MSKFKKINLAKKDEIEIEKMETGTNIDKTALSGIISKNKISKKEEILNKSKQENPLPEKEMEYKSNISISGFIKTPKEKDFKKFNSDNVSGYFTFNNVIKPFPIDSEQERFDKIKFKTIKIKNNNIIKRVREFVPAKEYLNLLDEIDDEEEEEEINNDNHNSKTKDDSKLNKENNNNSENQNLNNIEDNKICEEPHDKNINTINQTHKEEINDERNSINKNIFDIYNIDINLDFNSKRDNIDKANMNNLFNFNHNLFKNSLFEKSFHEKMKEQKEIKFKKEYYDNFSIYTTNIFFKYGEYSNDINDYQKCVLLLRKPFLFVLNSNSTPITEQTIKFFNPDISLIDNIERKTKNDIKQNNYILKNRFNLSAPLLSLNFNLLSCILLINKKININEFQIMILGTKDKFSIIINDKVMFNKYTYLIQNMIKNTEGSRENKLGLSLRNNIFYREIYITVSDFERQAKTGDLLLFKTMDPCANCQRFFTCDAYDHVGLIMVKKNKENKEKKLYIFESTSIGKCTPLSWNSFIQLLFNLVYYRIAYRKLNYENKDLQKKSENMRDFEKNCLKYIEEIKGKNYYLSIPRFLCCKSPDSYEYEKDWNKAKGLCCSALVAAIYIKMGVVKLEKSVHSTRPGDFEHDRNRLTFEEGYSLGPEKIIEFSE